MEKNETTNKVESAKLILELYDLRREAKMREARDWIFGFQPESADHIMATMMDDENGAYLRMVTSYWEMAAALVNHGAIDGEMFRDTAGEHIMVFAKIEPFLSDLREKFQNDRAFRHLEKLIDETDGGRDMVRKTQEWFKSMASEASENTGESAAA